MGVSVEGRKWGMEVPGGQRRGEGSRRGTQDAVGGSARHGSVAPFGAGLLRYDSTLWSRAERIPGVIVQFIFFSSLRSCGVSVPACVQSLPGHAGTHQSVSNRLLRLEVEKGMDERRVHTYLVQAEVYREPGGGLLEVYGVPYCT